MPDQLPVLIVDDEQQSRSLIHKLLSVHFPALIVEEADTVSAATECIIRLAPKLVFLDVQMRGETGFDLLDKIEKPDFGIIFTTAHSEFALKAFRYSAMNYLVKPLDTGEFKSAVDNALSRIQSYRSSAEQISFLKKIRSDNQVTDKLTIPTPEGFLFINIKDIIYCEATGNYTTFHLQNGQKLVSSYTLGYYQEMLDEHSFFRAHRSWLVNLHHIKMYKKGDGGTLFMDNGDEIEISRNNKEALLKVLKLRP